MVKRIVKIVAGIVAGGACLYLIVCALIALILTIEENRDKEDICY